MKRKMEKEIGGEKGKKREKDGGHKSFRSGPKKTHPACQI